MRNSVYQGMSVGNLKSLRPVFERWQILNEELRRNWRDKGENDAPWWYSERASLSVFAGAVWLCNGGVLEEFGARKTERERSGKKIRYTGRCDLWFRYEANEFMAEAKQRWLNLSSSVQENIERISYSLDEASGDCRCGPRFSGKRLAMVFASPRLALSKQDSLEESLKDFLQACQKVRGADIVWTFPSGAGMAVSESDMLYPGIVLFVRAL